MGKWEKSLAPSPPHVEPPSSKRFTIFTQMQDEVFFLKFGAQIYGVVLNWSTKQHRTKPDCSEPALACIAKSSCEISAFLRYYAALNCSSVLTFWDNLLVSPSRVKKSEEQRTTEVHWHSLLWDFVIYFLKKNNVLEDYSVSVYRERSI